MQKLIIKIFFIVSIFLIPFVSQAYQLYLSAGADLTISATPANPGPHQEVVIKVQSYRYDLDHSLIAWQKDGKQSSVNNGLKTYTFRTGAAGSQTVIGLTITPGNGERPIQAVVTFTPVEIELVWEANSYTPYWYKGKAKPGANSQIRVSALTRITDTKGREISPQSLVYNWTRDGKILPNDSGVGKSSLIFKSGNTNSISEIRVTVSSPDKSISSSASTKIKIIEPKVLFYEDKPLFGTVYQTALNKEVSMSGQIIVRAEPFYFSNKDLLNFDWFLNNKKITGDEKNPNRLYLKAADKNVSSRIGVRVTHPQYFLQDKSGSLVIKSNGIGSL